MIARLPEDTQTLHAELLALLLASDSGRQWSHLAGSFTKKTVAGKAYVYFQYSDPGNKKRQLAIGPDTKALAAILKEHGQLRQDHELDLVPILRLARLLHVAGIPQLPHAVARVLGALADAGVFRLGAALVDSTYVDNAVDATIAALDRVDGVHGCAQPYALLPRTLSSHRPANQSA